MKGRQQSPANGAVLDDFPEFIGPMVVKELRQGVRGKMFVVPFLAIHLLMLAALGLDLAAHHRGYGGGAISPLDFIMHTVMSGMPGQAMFWQVAFLFLLVVMPWAGLSALSREREGHNGELLLMAGVTRWRIVLGKWSVLCALGLLTATTMLPYLLVRYFLGGMNVPATMITALVVVLLNATANALAIGLSGYRSIGARILVGVFVAPAFYISLMITVFSTAGISAFMFSSSEILAIVGGLIGAAGACFLYITLGLQLGRMHLRPFERPYEDTTSGGMVALMIFSPLILGMIAILTAGFGGIVGAGLLAWMVIKSERTHAERRRPRLYPPSQANQAQSPFS